MQHKKRDSIQSGGTPKGILGRNEIVQGRIDGTVRFRGQNEVQVLLTLRV